MRTILSVSLLFLLLTFPTYSQTGWYEQTLPISGTISDMQFIDSKTGWITLYSPFNFIKTTNGGKNWKVLFSGDPGFGKFDFINDSVGYMIGGNGMNQGVIRKSTNGGENWTIIQTTATNYTALDFVNQDTGWFGAFLGFDFKQIIRTTNGGQTLELQYSYMSAGQGINEVFFIDKIFDGNFYGWFLNNGSMSKTTNSGFNWSEPTSVINGNNGNLLSLFFLNRDTGWISFDQNVGGSEILNTTNGGINWIQQIGLSSTYNATDIEFVNPSKGWSGRTFLKVYATTNGGEVWGLQNTTLFETAILEMADTLNGWVGDNQLAHTTDGGGLITYIGVDPVNTEVPDKFILKQNYPNPFNPQTTIEFSIKQNSNVSLRLYDILGKEIIRIYDNENLPAGNYKAVLDFSKKELSSGAYFYTLTVYDGHSGYIFGDTKKLMYLK